MKRHIIFVDIILLLIVVAVVCACDQPRVRPVIEPGAVLLSFERSGGIAGFQDRLVIGYDGEYYLSRYRQLERIGTLSAERRAQLEPWLAGFGPFTLTFEDNPGGPDNMKRQLVWTGTGKAVPTQAQQNEILDWASSLLDELSAAKE